MARPHEMSEKGLDEFVRGLKRACFFCAQPLNGKKSLEHIIPDSLLGRLGLKEQYLGGLADIQYSRIKVPAHPKCNNEFGSAYEHRVLKLLGDTSRLFSDLIDDDQGVMIEYSQNQSPTMIVSTWLAKVYYGLFYNNLLKAEEHQDRTGYAQIVGSPNFETVQNAYRNGTGFCLPSSLYVLESRNTFFDLRTMIFPRSILVKVDRLTMILCLEDGFLTKHYLGGDLLAELRTKLGKHEANHPDFPIHLFAFAEIQALRSCIPKSPSFLYTDEQVWNTSKLTFAADPVSRYAVDSNEVRALREAIFTKLVPVKMRDEEISKK